MWPLLPLLACVDPATAPADDSGGAAPATSSPVDIASPMDGWLRGDLHFHTNHSDDALEQNGDWMAGALLIADAWRAPEWTAAFPDLAPDDHLQFVAVTDHRTTAGLTDPDFGHETLVVIGGEEFGSDGHAGIWGHQEHIPHEPQAGEDTTTRIGDAIAEAHAQGGLFSINHPLYSGDLWAWQVEGFDAVEIWNAAWSTMGMPTDEATLDAWLAARAAPENPWIRAAVRLEGVNQNAQAVRFWQAILSSGHHVAPVGGGDRHMLFPAGMPTTYVMAADRTPQAVLAGLADGHSFVSRGPQGPQVLLEAQVDGALYPMGSALPAGAATVEIHWRAGRAAGGELRLVAGALGEGAEPEVVARFDLASADESGSFTWVPPAPGGWLHAVVVDPLPGDVPKERLAAVEALGTFPDEGGLEALITGLAPMIDLEIMSDPGRCDVDDWDAWSPCCMPADTDPWATFYMPPALQAWMSVEFVDGASTGFAMGAISSAFMVGAGG